MRLQWEYLMGSIFFFGVFFFDPLLRAMGPERTTIIICTALAGIIVIKIAECLTYKCCCKNEENENDNDN